MARSGEWVEWHRGYEKPDGLLARRLAVVQRLVAAAIDRAPPDAVRVISMCAGDGRDLLGVLAAHPRRRDVRARLVELDESLVARGRERAAHEGLDSVELVCGDASDTCAYRDAAPADVLLVCGVFGNVTDEDVHNTVARLPELCAPGATVVWTRGRFEPDLTPAIRSWFGDAGFAEIDFVPIAGTTAAVGAHRLTAAPRPYVAGVRLFTFLEERERPSRRCSVPYRATPSPP
ncbi:MAG TPA: class I SAM-dependent methyltransferase [Candidatus Dormibacteraeota bacterium]